MRRTIPVSGAVVLAGLLADAGADFRVVGSVAAGSESPRDLDVVIAKSERSTRLLADALESVAVGEWRGRLWRWHAGAILSPVTIATMSGPLDVWGDDCESG